VFACAFDGRTVAYGCGVSSTDALRDGLIQTLAHYQALANDEQDYAPAAVPGLPTRLRGTRPSPMARTRPLSVADLVAALVRGGHSPAVVPLDHDPEVRLIMPYIGRVVMIDD
jgi:hypothetical protein